MNETTDSETDLDPSGEDQLRGEVAFDRRMLEALVCPVTQAALGYDAKRQELVSRSGKLAFPIRNGIPIMLFDEARSLE